MVAVAPTVIVNCEKCYRKGKATQEECAECREVAKWLAGFLPNATVKPKEAHDGMRKLH